MAGGIEELSPRLPNLLYATQTEYFVETIVSAGSTISTATISTNAIKLGIGLRLMGGKKFKITFKHRIATASQICLQTDIVDASTVTSDRASVFVDMYTTRFNIDFTSFEASSDITIRGLAITQLGG